MYPYKTEKEKSLCSIRNNTAELLNLEDVIVTNDTPCDRRNNPGISEVDFCN